MDKMELIGNLINAILHIAFITYVISSIAEIKKMLKDN